MLFSPSPKRSRIQLRISERRLLLMFGDALCVLAAVAISLYIWSTRSVRVDFDGEFIIGQGYWFFVMVFLWLLIAGANDFFELSVAAKRGASLQRLLVINLQMLVVYLIVFFLSPRDALPRLFIIYYGVASFFLIGAWRVVNPALIGWASTRRRVLIVGTDQSAETVIEAIRCYGEDAYEICGIIGLQEEVGTIIDGIPVIGAGDDLLNFVIRDRIKELVITSVPEMGDDIFRGAMEAYERGVALVPMPILYERITGRVPVRHVNNNWAVVLPIAAHATFDPYPLVQRIMDVAAGLVGVALCLVFLPFIALAIRLDTPGNIFYTHIRTGLNGRPFRIYKFRTMVTDAEKDGVQFSKPGDSRVTRVGKFLRKTRLDELPQFINILKGDMALVGPRPERPEHIQRLTETIPFYRTRLVIRPGLTGWAQVRYEYGSNDVDALIKLEYDLYYIRNQSLLLDVTIILRTVGKVVRMAGV